MATTPPFDALAHVYDRWMARTVDYDAIEARSRALVDDAVRPRVLDLCTGTGALAVRIAEWAEVTGIDASAPMLELAVARAADLPTELRPALVRADAVTGPWPAGPWDLVTCTGDSANYLTPDELDQFLQRIGASLRPGGHALLDLNTPRKLVELFADTTYAESFDDYAYVWRNELAPDHLHIDFIITIFWPDDDPARWSRAVEVHRQHVHELDRVRATAAQSGLDVVSVSGDYADDRPAEDDALRWVFTFRKAST